MFIVYRKFYHPINYLKLVGNWNAEQPAKADKSAVCAINDSVGKFCKHVRTSPFSERRTEHYEKNLHMQRKRAAILAPPSCLMPLLFACRRWICSFTSSKGGVLSRSSTRQLVRTDFPNRVIYRAHRRFIGPRWMWWCPHSKVTLHKRSSTIRPNWTLP